MLTSTKISIKVSLENDTRRITLNEPSYSLLQKTLSKLFRLEEHIFVNNLIQVKYKDDENDVITISTDDEFQEAISLSCNLQTPTLRLFLVHSNPKRENPPPKVHQKPSPPQPNQSCFWQQLQNLFNECTKESLETARTLLLKHLSILPNHSHHLYNLACVESLLGNLEQAVDYLDKAIRAGYKNLTHIETDSDLDSIRHLEKYKDLVSSLQKSLPYQNRKCNGVRPHFQWHFLQQLIDNHFDIGTSDSLEEARSLLHHQLSIVPGHPIPLYNLACVETLLGDVDIALHFLEEAIHAGYRDVGHMETDKDLDGLRHLEKYKILVASLKDPKPKKVEDPKPKKVEDPKPEKVEDPKPDKVEDPKPDKVEDPKPKKVEDPKPDEDPKPEKVEGPKPDKVEDPCLVPHPWGVHLKALEEMGLNDQQKNKMVLEITQGDLTAAIQMLLDLF